ncbi:NUDIX hydrolase [Luteipulveratus halotolerans]|uniref:NUDIX hydrolase n=1 Tax=Luteipulveratus halotolerans TaxID=1631356 RepID=A0A0L6CE06_9MICO|nr:NUDIX domain-containing protein [Luteipulveratus halotolerans]KNX36101.1 NUDIX hydrolase [Luteipulveratus halotolerans]
MTSQPRTTAVDFPVGGRLREHAERPVTDPPAARLASTVMLVRSGNRCAVEVFMLRRVPTMEFAPSMWVFPGGGVDQRDAEPGLPWAGPSPTDWAERIGVDEPTAQQLVIAAVREVFEECGVLLAGPDAETVVGDVSGQEWHAERAALLSKEQSFTQLLTRRGLVLRSDLLTLRDHWVTPEFEPKRYDTYFFAALLPIGQVADDATTEADTAVWIEPETLLAQADSREALMLPPTVVNVRRVASATSPEAFVAARPPVVRVMPEPVHTDEGVVLRAHLVEQ